MEAVVLLFTELGESDTATKAMVSAVVANNDAVACKKLPPSSTSHSNEGPEGHDQSTLFSAVVLAALAGLAMRAMRG